MFHECSSRKLKHMFSHSAEQNPHSDLLVETASPKLPLSVSRSRGKHYGKMNEETKKFDLLMNKKHPVKALHGQTLSFYSQISAEGITASCEKSKVPRRTKSSLFCERSSSGVPVSFCNKDTSISENTNASSSSTALTGTEGNCSSTVTCGSSMQHQHFFEVSSQSADNQTGLLSALRKNLRRSCVTRQVSRIEVSDNRQLKSRKYSSSKSSVGSSTSLGYDGKSLTVEGSRKKKDQTADNSSVTRMSRIVKKREKTATVTNESTAQIKNMILNSNREGIASFSRFIHSRADNVTGQVQNRKLNSIRHCKDPVAKLTHNNARPSKVKVRHQIVNEKASVLPWINRRDPVDIAEGGKDKTGVRNFRNSAHAGKENAIGRAARNQNVCKRDGSTGFSVHQKLTRGNVLQKAKSAGLPVLKEKVVGDS